jgi:phage terminase large subunit-like protein
LDDKKMTGYPSSSGSDWASTRRRFLAVSGAAAGAVLAGCSSVTSQSFTASPVLLPDETQTELLLAETTRDSRSVTLDGPADTQVEITNQAAVYKRATGLGGQ